MLAQSFSKALLLIVVTLTEQIAAGQIGAASRSTAAVPTAKSVEAARQVIESFGRYNLVGLGERHGNLEDSQFRLRIIRDPEFAQRVNDVVIEFGNPLYQDILDRFVEGANVSHVELSKVWKETTQRGTGVWNSPIYEELIVAVRAVNAAMPSGKHLRVLAADYPIDWTLIDAEKAKPFPREDVIRALWKNVKRDVAAADIIRRSVLDPGRKALVIFGGNHFFRNDSSELINLFQEDSRAKWFSINPVGGGGLPVAIAAHHATQKEPILLMARGAVGSVYAGYLSWDIKGWDATPGRVKLRQLVDACLYFGPEEPRTTPLTSVLR